MLELSSQWFTHGEAIPGEFTCDGEDTSPDLTWAGVPETAQSLVLILDDPDAPGGTWVHWVAFNLPPGLPGLPGAVPAEPSIEGGGLQGVNSWGRLGYGGPCPPSGTHRYFFKLYALDELLSLEPGAATKEAVLSAAEGHILTQAELMGTYSR